MKSRILFFAIAFSLLGFSPASAAEPIEAVTGKVLERVFSEAERAVVEEYFKVPTQKKQEGGKSKKKGLPPGLAKKGELPPGLQKQLEKNGRLPPGLAKRELPGDLLGRLPTAPKGTKRYVAGSDVVLVDAATEVILDVIRGVAK